MSLGNLKYGGHRLKMILLTCLYAIFVRLVCIVINGFLSFCQWFPSPSITLSILPSPDGRYFISPLRINGSALESTFSALKHTSGGNLSAIAYSPALGMLINRRS